MEYVSSRSNFTANSLADDPAPFSVRDGDAVIGALVAAVAAGLSGDGTVSKWLGLLAMVPASINIFGGFAVTARMLAVYKKKER